MIDQTQGRRTRYGEVWRLPYLGFSEFSAQIFESDVQQPSLELFQCFYLSEREKEDAKRKMLRWTSIMGFFLAISDCSTSPCDSRCPSNIISDSDRGRSDYMREVSSEVAIRRRGDGRWRAGICELLRPRDEQRKSLSRAHGGSYASWRRQLVLVAWNGREST